MILPWRGSRSTRRNSLSDAAAAVRRLSLRTRRGRSTDCRSRGHLSRTRTARRRPLAAQSPLEGLMFEAVNDLCETYGSEATVIWGEDLARTRTALMEDENLLSTALQSVHEWPGGLAAQITMFHGFALEHAYKHSLHGSERADCRWDDTGAEDSGYAEISFTSDKGLAPYRDLSPGADQETGVRTLAESRGCRVNDVLNWMEDTRVGGLELAVGDMAATCV